MKYLYNTDELRKWDQFTMDQQKISSIELMEKAGSKLATAILEYIPKDVVVHIFCGSGNNGGDGLVIARKLRNEFYTVKVYECKINKTASEEYNFMKEEMKYVSNIELISIDDVKDMPRKLDGVIVDAILGIGGRDVSGGLALEIIQRINEMGNRVISIDLPSGMPVDGVVKNACIRADVTATVERSKPSFFYEENLTYLGEIIEVPIGLDTSFNVESNKIRIDKALVASFEKPRKKFSHKGDYGHALIVAGKKGMAGAAILNGSACLRSGPGLVTMFVDEDINDIIQIALPEAMTLNEISVIDTEKFSCMCIGSGLGQGDDGIQKVDWALNQQLPTIFDADALNIIAKKMWIKRIPKSCIITPHPGEFDRLFGKHEGYYDRIQTQIAKSIELGIYIVLKTAHTTVTTPDGNIFFNTTGNPGMAKAGSGDVLTGLICGLLARYKDALHTCISAVYLHGNAGDLAAAAIGQEGMKAGDLNVFLPKAILNIQQ